ncbi:MAG: UDP-N-acetylmuramate--L-alanine ligase [Gammaproteobacteria bacterium]|nr:UDP-N-acetylmuramate--L-alanine ligase [Gammaproteobacteria bacterium]
MYQHIKHIYFVGIGGAGMSGIAEVLLNLGYKVSGSDLNLTDTTERLQRLGATIYHGHSEKHITDVDVVVTSSAIKSDNPESRAARSKAIPVIPRAEMLAELMRLKYGIAVAGAHGKTTATSLIAVVLDKGGISPTVVIGGKLNTTNTNTILGTGDFLVAEADESDASFLYLQPMLAVITNIDADHLETYGGDFDRLQDTFLEFLHHLPFYGQAVLCMDDEHIRNLLPGITRPVVTYGTHKDADIVASNIRQVEQKTQFELQISGEEKKLAVTLNMPGIHNVRNALAAIAVARELGVSEKDILRGLESFEGIGRRFQIYGELQTEKGKVLMIDDYGHHPREVEATITAIRQGWPGRRLVVLFQPHRYTRTRDLFEDFVQVLSETDILLLTEVYSAGEEPVFGADGRTLARAIRARGQVDPVFIEDIADITSVIPGVLKDNDILLTLGAGDIAGIAAKLPEEISLSNVTGDLSDMKTSEKCQ